MSEKDENGHGALFRKCLLISLQIFSILLFNRYCTIKICCYPVRVVIVRETVPTVQGHYSKENALFADYRRLFCSPNSIFILRWHPSFPSCLPVCFTPRPLSPTLSHAQHTLKSPHKDLPEPPNKPENITHTIGPQSVQLSASRYDTTNLLNIIDESYKIIHWQRHSINRLEQSPLRRTLEDSLKQKDAHIKELTRQRLPEMMWWGRDAEANRRPGEW